VSVGDDQQLFMRPAYFKSLALHFLFPAFLMLVVHWLDKIWQRPDLRPVPEYLEVSLLESPPVKKQTAAAKKSSPIEPAEKKPDPPKPKPAPPKVEEPPPPPIPPKAEVQPIVEKKTTPVEKSKAPTSAPVVPPTPTKKAPKKTPPPLPSLDQGMDELLEDEQETLDELKKEAKQSKNKSNQDKAATDARRTDEESVVGHYSALIRDRVEQSWLRPPSVRPGMEAILQVKLLPGGEVRDVEIIQSSGDQAFDYSALKAIREARILPVPEDNGLFNRYFRVIQFPFRPEDLQR
jgi:TonB family protein